MKIPNQLSLNLNKPADSTPQQVKEWEETDYFRKGDFDPLFLFVVIPTIIQVSALLFMGGVMWITNQLI